MTAIGQPIYFNSTSGSDTTASGSSAGANVYGSGASTTSASSVVTGITTTGVQAGDLLWVQSSSGRQFSVIASVDSGTQVTCDDTFANTESSRTWAIGGKRSTFDNADSRRLFNSDVIPDATIESETDQSISSNLVIGPGTTTQPLTVDCKNNAIVRTFTTAWTYTLQLREYTIFKNATHTTATNFLYGIQAYQQGANNRFQWIENVHVSNFWSNFGCSSAGNYNFTNCSFKNANDIGLYADVPTNLSINSCVFDGNAKGVEIDTGTVSLHECLVTNNTSNGCDFNSANVTAISSIFYNNTNSGMLIAGSSFPDAKTLGIRNNIFDSNGAYGVNVTATGGFFRCHRNAFRNNSSGETAGITSVDGITLQANPFVDAANGDFTVNSDTLKAVSYSLNDDTKVYAFSQFITPVVDSSQPQEAGTQVSAFGQWAITNPEAALHPLRSS